MGVAVTKKMYETWGGSPARATFQVASIFAKSNMVYTMQLNIVLTIGELFIDTDGSEDWDNGPSRNDIGKVNKECTALWNSAENYPDINRQLDLFKDWTKPSEQALWHLFDDCFAPPGSSGDLGNGGRSGTAGLATMAVLCTDSGIGVSFDSGDIWKTFAHEVGHNFNGEHSFEDGQGITGGIMDYGDGFYNGVEQFNTKYRKTVMCAHVKTQFDSVCNANQVTAFQAECGDGIVDSSEECECAGKVTSCNHCTNCKLTGGAQCTPDAYDITKQACCNNNGMFAAPGSTCNTASETKNQPH